MAGVRELLRIVVEADTDGAVRGISNVGKVADRDLGKAEQRIDKVGAGFRKAGAIMLGAGALMAGGLIKTIGAASDLNEAVNVTGLVFGDASDEMGDFAKSAATGLGLSETAARQATAQFGGLLKNLGFAQGETVSWSKDLTTLAADMGSAFNTSTEDAILAIGAGLRGESEPLKRFNVFLSETELKTKAVELGLAGSTSEVDRNAKAQAALATIMEQTSDVQGDFANTSDGAANASKIAAAEFENAKASLGTALLPVVSKGAGLLSDLAGGFVSVNESTNGMLSNIALGTTAFLLIGGTIASAVGQVIKMRDTLGPLITRMRTAGTSAGFLTKSLVGIGTALVVFQILRTAIDKTGSTMDELRENAGDTESAYDGLRSAIEADSGALGENAKKMVLTRLEAQNMLSTFADAGVGIDEYAAAVQRAADAGDDGAARTKALENVMAKLETQLGRDSNELAQVALTTGVMVDQTGKAQGALSDTAQITGKAADAADSHADALGEEADQAAETEDAIKELNDALKAQFDPLFAAQDALLENRDAQADYTRTAKEVKAAQDKVTEATRKYGPESKKAREATNKLRDAQRAHADAGRKVARTALDVSSATTELSRKMQSGSLTTKGMKEQLRVWVAQGLLTERQAERVAGDLQRVGDRARSIDGTQVRLSAQLLGAQAVENMLNTIARHRTSIVSVVGRGPSGQFSGGRFFHDGGLVPGSPDQAVPITAHGGEYVLSADVVDRIKRGAPSRGADTSVATGGGQATQVRVSFDTSGLPEDIATMLKRRVRVDAGGDAQKFFGRSG